MFQFKDGTRLSRCTLGLNLHTLSCWTGAFISPPTLHVPLISLPLPLIFWRLLDICSICNVTCIRSKSIVKNRAIFCNTILVVLLNKQFGDKCCWQQPFIPTLKWCLGCLNLGEKWWAHPLLLTTIPPGAWHRYTPPCLCAPWHLSPGLIYHLPSTGLARGRQFSSSWVQDNAYLPYLSPT